MRRNRLDRAKTMRKPTHPGDHIAFHLEAMNMSAAQLAKQLGIPANRVTEIIRHRRGITADTAIRLGTWLGTTPQYWMNLQSNYDLKTAELESGDEIRKQVQPHSAQAA
jgi:addiction module HigA family antidote